METYATHVADAALSAVEYADLLAVEGLAARNEVERLHALAARWQEIVAAPGFDEAVTAATASYHKTECVYGIDLAALREAVRLAVWDLLQGRGERGVIADLRAALPVSHVES